MSEQDKKEYEVLARKYRPNSLAGLIGQDALVQTLTNAIETNRIPHAFIMTGIRGVGKTSTARIIARSLICTGADGKSEMPTASPCGICENCRAIAEDRHIDILEMDAASRTGINDIREIIDSVHYHPVIARYKIYIIDEVHMLSKQAFNALLKTLEEPPANTKFIFATTEIRKVPVTVLSRCMRFDLPRVGIETLSTHLESIAKKEGATISAEALALISQVSEGSVRDSLSLLDQAIGTALEGETIDIIALRNMLGMVDRNNVFDLFEMVISAKPAEAITKIREMYNFGADPIAILQDLLEVSHFITEIKILPNFANEKHIAASDAERGKILAEKLSIPFLARIWQMLVKGISEVQLASNTLTASEMILIRIAYASELPTPEKIIKDIKKNSNISVNSSNSTSPPIENKEKSLAIKQDIIHDDRNIDLEDANAGTINNPNNFNEMADIFNTMNEPFIHARLRDVSPISFDAKIRKIEFCPTSHTPPDLAGKIGEMLSHWTGNRWLVVVSSKEGKKSIRQKNEEELEKQKKEAVEDNMVQAILKAFPDSRITAINKNFDDEDNIANIKQLT